MFWRYMYGFSFRTAFARGLSDDKNAAGVNDQKIVKIRELQAMSVFTDPPQYRICM